METQLDYSSRFYKADQRVNQPDGPVSQQRILSDGSFGSLVHFSDVFHSPQQHVTYSNHEFQQILIPIVGGFLYSDATSVQVPVSSETVLLAPFGAETFIIGNPFEKDRINYLHLGIQTRGIVSLPELVHPLCLRSINTLSTIKPWAQQSFYISAGVFSGRTKGSYHLHHPSNGLFCFVINGAFEVEERLMEHRDGLALWETKQINFEALSEHAILLVLELSLNNHN